MYGLKKIYGTTMIKTEEEDTLEAQPKTIQLKYYTTKEHHFKLNGKQYGVGIIKTEIRENEVSEEKQEFHHICQKKEEVKKLLNMLLRNKVTPMHLKYVLDDLLLQ